MCLALKATGSVLLHLQWDGRTEQRKFGLSVRTSSPAWSARTSTMFLVSGLDLRGPGVAIAPLLSPILLQGKDVEGGVNRLVVGGSTGICITTVWVRATWMGWIRQAGLFPPGAEGLRSPQREDGGESALRESSEDSGYLYFSWGASGGSLRFSNFSKIARSLQTWCWTCRLTLFSNNKLLQFSLEISQ